MKATGVIRRIDDLGRIVLPKELRRIYGINDGTPMEIFTTPDGIILRKYRAETDLLERIREFESQVIDSQDSLDTDGIEVIEKCLNEIKRVLKTETAAKTAGK